MVVALVVLACLVGIMTFAWLMALKPTPYAPVEKKLRAYGLNPNAYEVQSVSCTHDIDGPTTVSVDLIDRASLLRRSYLDQAV